jgi:hypothetical protein
MIDSTLFCCAVSRVDQFKTAGRYRHVLSISLKDVSGNIGTHEPRIVVGAQGINVPISRGGPPTEFA